MTPLNKNIEEFVEVIDKGLGFNHKSTRKPFYSMDYHGGRDHGRISAIYNYYGIMFAKSSLKIYGYRFRKSPYKRYSYMLGVHSHTKLLTDSEILYKNIQKIKIHSSKIVIKHTDENCTVDGGSVLKYKQRKKPFTFTVMRLSKRGHIPLTAFVHDRKELDRFTQCCNELNLNVESQ